MECHASFKNLGKQELCLDRIFIPPGITRRKAELFMLPLKKSKTLRKVLSYDLRENLRILSINPCSLSHSTSDNKRVSYYMLEYASDEQCV